MDWFSNVLALAPAQDRHQKTTPHPQGQVVAACYGVPPVGGRISTRDLFLTLLHPPFYDGHQFSAVIGYKTIVSK